MKNRRKNAIFQLREYDTLCKTKVNIEKALAVLTPEDRLVLQLLDIAPAIGNGAKLCELFGCEIATVYRRRNRALQRFSEALFGT